MKVSEFMTKQVFTLSPENTVHEAALLMLEKNISAIPIVDGENKLVGIITESDFVGRNSNTPHALASLKKVLGHTYYSDGIEDIFKDADNMPVKKAMSDMPQSVDPDNSLDDVVYKMNRLNLKRIPVVLNGKLVGIVTRHDIIRAFSMLHRSSNQPQL